MRGSAGPRSPAATPLRPFQSSGFSLPADVQRAAAGHAAAGRSACRRSARRRRAARAPARVDQRAAHMAAAHRLEPLDAHVGQGEQRLRIAGPERLPARANVLEQRPRRGAGRDQRVDLQRVLGFGGGHLARPGARRGRRGTPARAEGRMVRPGGHGVAAAGQQQALVEGGLDGAAEIDAGLRAAGALADVGGADRGRSPPPGVR